MFLLVLPIAKADGCGINCPHGNDLLTFSLSMLCQFFTWGFCHIFSFVVLVIVGIVIFVFWRKQEDEKKKKIKIMLYALFGLFVIIILSDYIKAFAYSSPISTSTDSCADFETSDCQLSGSGASQSHTAYVSTNHWRIICPKIGTATLEVIDGSANLSPNPVYITTGGMPEDVTATGLSPSYTVRIKSCTS
jgi:hypothetical protein